MTNNESGKELLCAAEAAELLKVTKRTILRWARDGKVECVRLSAKVVLFTTEAMNRFVKSGTVEVKSSVIQNQGAGRKVSSPQTKKGGLSRSSKESWRSLRQEVASWQ